MPLCVCVCARACVRVRVRACVRARALRACARCVHACVRVRAGAGLVEVEDEAVQKVLEKGPHKDALPCVCVCV